jgi:hypothetical protein
MARSYVGQPECRDLLAQYDEVNGHDYDCPERLDSPQGSFSPPTPTFGSCIRDSYVDTAVQYCWAAECYAEKGVDDSTVAQGLAEMTPEDAAALAIEQLENARALCSNAPVFGTPQRCPTTDFYPCPGMVSGPIPNECELPAVSIITPTGNFACNALVPDLTHPWFVTCNPANPSIDLGEPVLPNGGTPSAFCVRMTDGTQVSTDCSSGAVECWCCTEPSVVGN